MKSPLGHLAVIMARGDSRRMGRPKGLCRLVGDEENFVTRVSACYRNLEIPTLLVVRREDESAYREHLAGTKVEIQSAGRGGGTGLTMNLAWKWAAERGLEEAIFWIHPVDLPLVREETFAILLNALVENPTEACRPWHQDVPGHPVLIPGLLLPLVLAADPSEQSMSQAWEAGVGAGIVTPMRRLDVADPGVITDFDRPGQLDPNHKRNEPRS